MPNRVWFIARTELLHLLRMRETILWLLVMPPVFMFFIGSVTGNFSGRGPAANPITLTAPTNSGFLAGQLARRLEAAGFQVTNSPQTPASPARRVSVPENFTQRVLAGKQTPVTFSQPPGALAGELDQLRVARATYTVLADLAACLREGQTPGAESFERFHQMPRALTLDIRPAGHRRETPSGFDQAVPGILVMFAMIVMLTSGAVSLIAEREQGIFRRLASTPLTRGEIFTGKWAGRLALGAVQIVFVVIAARVLFGMNWGPDLPMILLVLLAWAAVCSSLGLWLGTVARTDGQAIGLGVLASNLLAALGGCWWPVEITPPWMQTLASLLPTGWTMDALHQLISFRAGPSAVWPHLAALAGVALLAGWLGARRFRFD